ncbi:hypothetical protein NMY22_g5681 [Coprinellus aureogranulatus]|nr:hypothetical protein NMY22_g5681 [Coprinellus aureogranulatus]
MVVQKIADIEYVLFDLDDEPGDLVTGEILVRYGKKMTRDIEAGCMGKRRPFSNHCSSLLTHLPWRTQSVELESSEHLLSFFPDIPISLEEYLKESNELQAEMWPTVPLLPGVAKLVKHLKKYNIPMAIATGSRKEKYLLKTGHLQDAFGKPFPDIFLVAAKELLGRDAGDLNAEPTMSRKIERSKGLVLEDGLPGMQAGKRARMNVLWAPEPNLRAVENVKDGPEEADLVLDSLEDFRPEQWGLPPYDEEP